MCPHPSLDNTQSLFESRVFAGLVGIVGLLVECCDVIHHLQTETQTLICSVLRYFVIYFAYFLSMCHVLKCSRRLFS